MATTFYLKDTGTLSWNAANTKITAPVIGTLSISAGTSIYFATETNDRMMIDADGNVGIRTNEPEEIFHVATSTAGHVARVGAAAIGNRSDNANEAFFGHYTTNNSTDYAIKQSYLGDTKINATSDTQLAFMIDDGVVGRFKNSHFAIGVHEPTFPLHINVPNTDITGGAWNYFDSVTASVQSDTGTLDDVQIVAIGSTYASSYVTASDSRIKKDILEIPDGEALAKFRLLKPCIFKYIDVIKKGDEDIYGFIAQEVKDVLPHAVKTIKTEYIPNIYQGGTFNNNTITLLQPHSLAENGNIRLFITNKAKKITCPYTVIDTLKINIDTSDLSIQETPTNDPLYDEDGNQLDHNIFVYGVEVDDFNTLNKDAIWTTGIAALQEVDRIQQSNNIKIQDLITQLDAEKSKVSDLLARVTALENP